MNPFPPLIVLFFAYVANASLLRSPIVESPERTFIRACRTCNLSSVKRVLAVHPGVLQDTEALKFLSGKEDEGCINVLEYVLGRSRIPQDTLETILESTKGPKAFETIYKAMRKQGHQISSLLFQDICESKSPRILRALLSHGDISPAWYRIGAQRALNSGQVENMNLLFSKLHEADFREISNEIILLLHQDVDADSLEAALEHPIIKRFFLEYIEGHQHIPNTILHLWCSKADPQIYTNTLDVLLRFPEVRELVCTKDRFNEFIGKGYTGLAIIMSRRCPQVLVNPDTSVFISAMSSKHGPETFSHFADYFIQSSDDFSKCFIAGTRTLKRNILNMMYEWAKSNDHIAGIVARMKVVNAALELSSEPLKFLRPEMYQKHLELKKSFEQVQAEIASIKRARHLQHSQTLGADQEDSLNAQIEVLAYQLELIEPDQASSHALFHLNRRLGTFAYMEGRELGELKEIADWHGLDRVAEYLDRFNSKSS